MDTDECVWKDFFDESEKRSLDTGFLITGVLSVSFGLWLNFTILLTNLSFDRSYRNLANFTLVACVRRIVPLIAYFPFVKYNSNSTCCEFLAFLETFLAVFEVEWLTHVCIERYVVAKYTTNGWPIKKYHYKLFQCLCLFFASLYSFPPLIGIGKYGFDFSCSFCTFDIILQNSWKRYIVVAIFFLRSVKPATVMLMMLIWTRILEKKLVCSESKQNQLKFTKNVIVVVLVNQVCWSPIALIRGGVIFSQLMNSDPTVPASAFYVKWAMWIHWMAPALSALVLFALDFKLQEKMFQIHSKETTDEGEDKKNKAE